MTSFALLPCSGDVAQALLAKSDLAVPTTTTTSTTAKSISAPQHSALSALTWAKAVTDIAERCQASGDAVAKCVFCRAHYGAALLESGTLLLLAPHLPDQHGKNLLPQDSAAAAREDGAVVDVSAGDTHLVFCTLAGSVYSLGYDNTYGQLGDGSIWKAADAVTLTGAAPPLSAPRRLPGFGLTHLAEGQQSVSTTAEASATSSCGARARVDQGAEPGSTWYAPLNPSVETLAKSSGATKRSAQSSRGDVLITAVSCGAQHTLLLPLRRNGVYACGRGHCGQLSGPRMVPAQPVFRSISLLFGLPIESVLASGHHSFVLLQTGRLLAFGDNACGQLGLGHTDNVVAPTPVTFLGANPPAADASSVPGVHHSRQSDASPHDVTSIRSSPHLLPQPLGAGAQVSPGSAVISLVGDEYVAGNGTVVIRRAPASVQSSSLTTVLPLGGAGGVGGRGRVRGPLLDDKTYQSLRAPYNSVASTQFPLRVLRLSAERAPGEEAVAAVYACPEVTVVCTTAMEWFSCGLPLSQGVSTNSLTSAEVAGTAVARADGRGPLGRSLTQRSDAYSFGKMLWPEALTAAMAHALQAPTQGGGRHGAAMQSSGAEEEEEEAENEDEPGDRDGAAQRRVGVVDGAAAKARSRRATNAPDAAGKVTTATHQRDAVRPLTAVACFCYATSVTIAVRAPQQPQSVRLFVASANTPMLFDVSETDTHTSPANLAGPACDMAMTPLSPNNVTDCTQAATSVSVRNADWLLTVVPPVPMDEATVPPAIRLHDTVSDAVGYHARVGPSGLVGTQKGVLLM